MMRAFQLAVTWVVVAAAGQVNAAPITLPSSAFDTLEGSSNSGNPFGNGDQQIQLLYESSLFSGGPFQINGVRVRQDISFTEVSPYDSSNFQIDLSTTTATSSTISMTYDDNHGVDRTTVRSGPLSFAFTGGSNPNAFADLISFTTPFVYDPSSGNSLVIHFFEFDNSADFLVVDRRIGFLGTAAVFNSDPNDADGSIFNANDTLILQLDVGAVESAVPEPTSLALLATGAFGFMGYGWRRKRKQAA